MKDVDPVVLAIPNVSTFDVSAVLPAANAELDVHTDIDHGRSVLTYGGSAASVRDSCVALAASAGAKLSLADHRGAHPRFGVVDVLPLVPYKADEQTAADLADELRRYIDDTLDVPVYTYGRAHPDAWTLPTLRRYLRENAHRAHPTAGVVCLGIRDPLIAFNVNARGSIGLACDIARRVRDADVRALGFELRSRGLVQVSMNLVTPKRVGPRAAFARVAHLASAAGVEIVDCEVVGLVPEPNLAELEELPLIRPARSIEQALTEKGVL